MTENERQPVRAFTVDETAAGERLDKFLSTVCPDLTRSAAARVIEEGGVLLDGSPGNKKDKLRPGTRWSCACGSQSPWRCCRSISP